MAKLRAWLSTVVIVQMLLGFNGVLSEHGHDSLEGILPRVHLDDSNTTDHFVHHFHTLVSHVGRLEPLKSGN